MLLLILSIPDNSGHPIDLTRKPRQSIDVLGSIFSQNISHTNDVQFYKHEHDICTQARDNSNATHTVLSDSSIDSITKRKTRTVAHCACQQIWDGREPGVLRSLAEYVPLFMPRALSDHLSYAIISSQHMKHERCYQTTKQSDYSRGHAHPLRRTSSISWCPSLTRPLPPVIWKIKPTHCRTTCNTPTLLLMRRTRYGFVSVVTAKQVNSCGSAACISFEF